jgi:nonribosomal peptide synthetase DhbF
VDERTVQPDEGETPAIEGPPAARQQQQLWFLDRLDPDSVTYNLYIAVRLRGQLSVPALERALTELVRRHETLRTTFTLQDGIPHQVVAAAGPFTLALDDLAGTPEQNRAEEASRFATAEIRRPFDLVAGPLFRGRLGRFADDDHVLVLVVHHICWDVRSSSMLCEELAELYGAFRDGRQHTLPEPKMQFGEYARRQAERLLRGDMADQLEYWKANLADLPILELPTDRNRPPVPSYRSEVVVESLDGATVGRIEGLAAARDATLLDVLLTAYTCVVARYSGQEDVVVATIIDARTPEVAPVWGFVTNSVVLRVDASGDPTFGELLDRVRAVVAAARRNREVPFETVVAAVQAERDTSRNPLFQCGVQLFDRDTGARVPELPGLQVEQVPCFTGQHPVDTSILAFQVPGRLDLVLNYATDLFDRPRMERMMGHFQRALLAGIEDPALRLSRVPLLSEAEQKQVLEAGLGAERPWRRELMHKLFAERADATPDALAAIYEGEQVTYGELHRRTDLLARRLRAAGIGREDIVGIALGRGMYELVSIIGILKAGGAFVAVDPGQPEKRLAHIIADTAAKLVITHSEVTGLPQPDGWEPLVIDREWPAIESIPRDQPLEEVTTPDSLVYVCYTSGSTGQPKGVLVEHQHLAVFVAWHSVQNFIGPGSRVLQPTALPLDFAQGHIFSALTSGATLVIPSTETVTQPAALEALIRGERVNYIGTVPAMIGPVAAGPYPDLKSLIVGGEAYSGELVNRWNQPGRQFINGYGPTETTVGSTFYVCERKEWRSQPPIGRPMPNRWHYVLDRWGCLTPIGVPGELVIGGLAVARGYLNRPGLTAEKFVADPFRPGGWRVYRSGDAVCWTEDHQIHFLGRIDNQIKLRGMRIELEEIETVVGSHPEIANAVVVLREDTPGDKRIVAYVVGLNGHSLSDEELREHVLEALPAHMLPSAFVQMEELPLLANGKVDRRVLPAPPSAKDRQDGNRVMPRTPTEQVIADTFGKVLDVDRVGADDSFFDLGGNSLMANRVVQRLNDQLGAEITIRQLYTTPSVADLARALDDGRTPGSSNGDEGLLEQVEGLSEEEAATMLAGYDQDDDDRGPGAGRR